MDDQLKQLTKELGETINTVLSDSEQIARAVARIKEAGYEIFLVLQATISLRKLGENSTERNTFVSKLGVDPDPATRGQ